jgi:hypothetical protein
MTENEENQLANMIAGLKPETRALVERDMLDSMRSISLDASTPSHDAHCHKTWKMVYDIITDWE